MSPTVASSHRFAAALAAALADHMPEGLLVRSEDDDVYVQAGEETWEGSAASSILDEYAPRELADDPEPFERAAQATLDGVQDALSRARAVPWPVVPGDATAMPGPNARVTDGLLHLWFGDEEAPALRLEPIPLDALGL